MFIEQKATEAKPDIGRDFQQQERRMPDALQVNEMELSKKYESNASPGFIAENGKQQDRHDRPLAREIERPRAHQRQRQPEKAGPKGDLFGIGECQSLQRVVDGHSESAQIDPDEQDEQEIDQHGP